MLYSVSIFAVWGYSLIFACAHTSRGGGLTIQNIGKNGPNKSVLSVIHNCQ